MLKLMKYMHAHCTAIYMMLLMIDKKYVKPFTHCSKLIRSLLYFKITVYPQPTHHNSNSKWKHLCKPEST